AARLDRLSDLVLDGAPAASGRTPHRIVRELDGALDRRPAQGLRVDEVLRLVAPLPDAAVRLRPALAGHIHEVDDEAPQVVVGRVAARVPAPREVEQLAVGVELELTGRGVADAHRARPAPAVRPVQLLLGQPPL